MPPRRMTEQERRELARSVGVASVPTDELTKQRAPFHPLKIGSKRSRQIHYGGSRLGRAIEES